MADPNLTGQQPIGPMIPEIGSNHTAAFCCSPIARATLRDDPTLVTACCLNPVVTLCNEWELGV